MESPKYKNHWGPVHRMCMDVHAIPIICVHFVFREQNIGSEGAHVCRCICIYIYMYNPCNLSMYTSMTISIILSL